jgi:hypothetical protein
VYTVNRLKIKQGALKGSNFAVNLVEEEVVYVRTVNLQRVTPAGIEGQRRNNTKQNYI